MDEIRLHDFARTTQRPVTPDFTAAIFARIDVDRYTIAPSALGEVYLAWNAAGVTAVRPAGDEEGFERWYQERVARRVVRAVEDDGISGAARSALRGEDVPFTVDLRACSAFEQRVLRKAAEIGRGHARPYAWVAREVGCPEATRAVGNALGRNPVPLLIPCHRVVRAGGAVGGYAFGSDAKRTLLAREGLDLDAVARLARRGVRYVASGDGTFCLPTCGDVATHADAPGYTPLHSLEEAHRHGLAPCPSCRPIAA